MSLSDTSLSSPVLSLPVYLSTYRCVSLYSFRRLFEKTANICNRRCNPPYLFTAISMSCKSLHTRYHTSVFRWLFTPCLPPFYRAIRIRYVFFRSLSLRTTVWPKDYLCTFNTHSLRLFDLCMVAVISLLVVDDDACCIFLMVLCHICSSVPLLLVCSYSFSIVLVSPDHCTLFSSWVNPKTTKCLPRIRLVFLLKWLYVLPTCSMQNTLLS